MTNRKPEKWTETETKAWIGLVKAKQHLVDMVEDELKKAGFPPLSWYDVLWELESSDGGVLRFNQIGDKVLLDKYNVTRLIQRLEKEDLVSRTKCHVDGRGQVACITPKGKKLRKEMWKVYERVVRENFLCKYNKKELSEFRNFVERLQASGLSDTA